MKKNDYELVLYDLDLFSIKYLYSCAGLCIDENQLTITSHSGNTIFSFNNNKYEKKRLFSFRRSCQKDPMLRVGDVCPLYPKSKDYGHEWCIKMVDSGMNRFYHMVVFALLLEAKRGIIKIAEVNIGNINDDQMKIFFAEKLPLLYQASSNYTLTATFEFIHTSQDLIKQFQKKYNKKFINEVINVSKFLIGDENFSLEGRESLVMRAFQYKIDSPELHTDRIIHYCKLAIFLQPYLLKQYDYDNKANELWRFLKSIDEFVKNAMELCLKVEPGNNSFLHPESIQTIDYNSIFNFIYDLVNVEFENIQTSLYRFLKLSNGHLIDIHPVRGVRNGQPITNNQFQSQPSPYMPQTPYAQPTYQDYRLYNNPQVQQQVYVKNFPALHSIDSQSFLPKIALTEPTYKIQRKIWEILNGLEDDEIYASMLKTMPFQKNDEYDKNILLLNRAEFELLKSVYNPEESHRFHLDALKIQVRDFNNDFSHELSAKDFVNSSLPIASLKVQNQKNYDIELNIDQIAQELGLKFPLPLLFIYSAIHVRKDPLQCATEIAQKTNISTDLDSLVKYSPLQEKGDFSEAIEPFAYSDFNNIYFKGENGSTYYQVIRGGFNWGNSSFYTEMPLIYVSKTGEQYHKPLLLPPKTHRLYGVCNLLDNKNVHTFLTEHLEIAHEYANFSDANFLSWWGGSHALDDVDFSPLKGRTVYYVLFDQRFMRTALKACRKIKDIEGNPNIVYCERSIQLGNNVFSKLNVKETDIYNDAQFEVLAERINYYSEMFDFFDTTLSDDSNKIDLVKGIIKSDQFIVVYGKEKSGKTYVCLSLSLGIACKRNPHELWEINDEINAGVMYCHGEMDDEDIHGRIDFLKKKMGIENTNINFESINLRDIKLKNNQDQAQLFNLTEPKCQTILQERVREFRKKHKGINQMLIVLDNYASLMGNSSQQGDMFNPAYGLILDLQKNFQCCVILVCHDNMQGAIASSRQIVRKVDGVIKVSRVAEWKEEIRNSFFSKKSVKNLIDFETIADQLKEEFVKKKGVIISHIDYQNFRNIDNLEPFSMTLRFNEEFDDLHAWEVEKSDKEKYIDDLIALYSENTTSKSSRKVIDSTKAENIGEGKVSFDKLKEMTHDEISEEIGKVWNQIGSNILPAKNGKVPILKEMAKYFSVSEPTFRDLGKEKDFEKGFTAETLLDIIKKYQLAMDTKTP